MHFGLFVIEVIEADFTRTLVNIQE